ncbi:D-alanine--D-alanine ligase [Candidatus Peregrinibacteria bacterium CG08_land_8_20_14_0_20_41_10]|nr:MAG: D-alanine--D-alanine ligase [Candidatus Peregrinibacteria bacterium CG08_land_8_20_14_0_20_41_10]
MDKSFDGKPPSDKRNGKTGCKVLGPVLNLEKYVRTDWWDKVFNSLYLKTDGDVVEDSSITRQEVDVFVETLKLTPEQKILDLCCGQGRHALELARRGFKSVEGLDRSHYLVQKAKENAKKENLEIKFREGDARKLPFPPDSFDVVLILGNSFGYFETIQDDLKVLQEILRVLKPWGQILIDVADGEYLKKNFQPRSWEWIDKKYFVCRERSLSLDKQRLISRELVSHAEKGLVADQFYAERLYSTKSLGELVQVAGFQEINFPGALAPDSQRNQDLGIMGKRLILTGRARKDWTPLKTKSEIATRHVVVLTGDPHKPDPLKPQSVFDDDDFYTIDQMKNALQELPGYRFTYLSNHDTLLNDLIKLKPKLNFVLNFCDEGYCNNPRHELHVPALLEFLGIPYTGAAPQCLAFCYDKSLVRGVAKEMDIPVPNACFIKSQDTAFELPFNFPAIVKPNFGDSSFGITQRSVVNSSEELLNAIAAIRQQFGYEKPMLIEEFLTGKDLSVGIIGNPPESYTVLPITEEDYSMLPPELPKLCGYEAKWLPTSPYWEIKSIRAELPKETERTLVEWCAKLFERLECRDYARFDWRLNAQGQPRLLEVNPNPGWCWDGHLAKMAHNHGLSYSKMLGLILDSAWNRINGNGSGQKKE